MFELKIVSLVAGTGTFGTTAQRISETAGEAIENILTDVMSSSPSETARVIAAEDVKRRVIRVTSTLAQWEDETLHHLLLSRSVSAVSRALTGHFKRDVE